ncbi:acyl carrier protein [Methylobacterium organophilum]|uniref:Acyl carrier protein n=1 Tax=Methylobacterium organophilum TaxID=410 RepID=A0ABQ4T9I0_METOR|nr:acyl carrier protein [Methylobacterium organophilum]UMY16518.1 acyl carrier protein [Methylobacterium organophilum]GJE27242.1 Acyl carrier protein [Methylobacterium organophilum]
MAQTASEVREAIFAFIAARNPTLPPGSVTGSTSLVTSDALDSIGILDLMMELGDRFGVEIDEDSFELSNFESVDALALYIDDRRSGD